MMPILPADRYHSNGALSTMALPLVNKCDYSKMPVVYDRLTWD